MVSKMMITSAFIDHGPNMPPTPNTGSKKGMIIAKVIADKGAW